MTGVVGAPEEAGARRETSGVYFLFPQNKASVRSPVRIRASAKGELVFDDGIFALLVDKETTQKNERVQPNGADIFLLDRGQSEASLLLSPGKHSLSLVYCTPDGVSRGFSQTIRITVEAASS